MTWCNVSSHYDFDRVWANWPAQRRKDVVQEAIIRAFTSQPTFQSQRRECREICIAYIEPKMLELLEYFMLDDMTQIPASPIIYPVHVCALDDAHFNPGEKLMLKYVRLLQTLMLCSVLGQVLSIFLGDPPLPTREPLKGNFKITAGGHKVDSAQKKAYKAMSAACEHCRKNDDDGKRKMQICGACKAIGRNMQYCDRTCQRADWPRHKTICGKELTLDTATATAVVNSPAAKVHTVQHKEPLDFLPSRACSIRPCVGGYKRSPALRRQVVFLQQNPTVDYYFCLPCATDNLISVALPIPDDSERFRAARDDVMREAFKATNSFSASSR
ncbi:hypothetical protein C8R43DRAFT_1025195 [Mycena crocata]|nr:hypothetical protein C8R43DRAFT_1025195 [Mycena crocata]